MISYNLKYAFILIAIYLINNARFSTAIEILDIGIKDYDLGVNPFLTPKHVLYRTRAKAYLGLNKIEYAFRNIQSASLNLMGDDPQDKQQSWYIYTIEIVLLKQMIKSDQIQQ